MGSYQHESTAPGLAPFTAVCDTTVLRDWRQYCVEGLLSIIEVRVTEEGWRERSYDAIVSGGDFDYTFRQPAEMESGGENGTCDYTTIVQNEHAVCTIKVPNLELMRVGLPEYDEEKWKNEFCRAYPSATMKHSPFTRSGSRLELEIDEFSSEDKILFADWMAAQLIQGFGRHLVWTMLFGEKEFVDQFDGFFTLLEDGNEADGACDYPLAPAVLDWGLLVNGIAGSNAHPISTVPAGHPPVVLHSGTLREVVMPVAEKDLLDIQLMWMMNVVNGDWGFQTNGWILAIGRNQAECYTRHAACKKVCTYGDCVAIWTNPTDEVAGIAANYINGKFIQYWPMREQVPLLESVALANRNENLLMPAAVLDRDGYVTPFTLVFQNMERDLMPVFQALNPTPLADEYAYGLLARRSLEFQQRSPEADAVIEQVPDAVFEVVPVNSNPFCFGLAMSAKATMVMEAPETMLRIQGVSCDEEPVTYCPEDWPIQRIVAQSCSTDTPGEGFGSALIMTLDPQEKNWAAGDDIAYQSAYGTTYWGVVRSYSIIDGIITIDFVEAGIDCDTGGGADGGSIRGNGSLEMIERYVAACDVPGLDNILVIDIELPAAAEFAATDEFAIESPLGSNIRYGTVTSIDVDGPGTATITITVSDGGAAMSNCVMETKGDGTDVLLEEGGKIRIYY